MIRIGSAAVRSAEMSARADTWAKRWLARPRSRRVAARASSSRVWLKGTPGRSMGSAGGGRPGGRPWKRTERTKVRTPSSRRKRTSIADARTSSFAVARVTLASTQPSSRYARCITSAASRHASSTKTEEAGGSGVSGRPAVARRLSGWSGSHSSRRSPASGVRSRMTRSRMVRSSSSGMPERPSNWRVRTRTCLPSVTWNTTTARVRSGLCTSRGSTRASRNPR